MWSDEASTITSPFLSRKKDSAGCGVKVSTKVRGKFHNIWGRPLLSMVPISTFHTQGSIDTIMTMYGYLNMQIRLKLGMSKYFYNDRETSLPAEGGPRLVRPGRNVKLGCWAAGLVPRSVCVQALLGPPPVLWDLRYTATHHHHPGGEDTEDWLHTAQLQHGLSWKC